MELIEYQMIHTITGPLWVSIQIKSLIQHISASNWLFHDFLHSSRRRWSDCCDGNEIQEFWEINACRTHGRTEVKLQLRQSINSCVKTYKDMSRLTELTCSDLMIFNVYVFALGSFKGGDFFIKIRRTSFHPNSQAEPCLMQEVKCSKSLVKSLVYSSHVFSHWFSLHEHKEGYIKSFLLICSNKAFHRNKLLYYYCIKYMFSHINRCRCGKALIILLVYLLFSASSWFCVFWSSKSLWTDHTGTCLTTSTGQCSFHSIITLSPHCISFQINLSILESQLQSCNKTEVCKLISD